LANLTQTWNDINAFITANIQSYFPTISFSVISSTPIDPNAVNDNVIFWGHTNGNIENYSMKVNLTFGIKFFGSAENVLDGMLNFIQANPNLNAKAILWVFQGYEVQYGTVDYNYIEIDTDLTLQL
jgi:hypothetical protein